MDKEHQNLFHLINELIRLSSNGAEPALVEELMKETRRSVIQHFENEEELMGQHGVSKSHHQIHLSFHHYFIQYIDRIQTLFKTHPNAEISILFTFLQKLIVQHLTLVDGRMMFEINSSLPGKYQEEENAANIKGMPVHHSDTYDLSDFYMEHGERAFEVVELRVRLKQEIANRKKIESTLQQTELRRKAMVDYVRSWEYWQDENGVMMYTSPSCERITGYKVSEFIENSDLMYQIIHPDDQNLMKPHQTHPHKHEEGEDEVEFRIIKRDGTISWIFHECSAVYGLSGEFLGRRGSNRDHNELHEKKESLLLAETVFNAVNEAILVTDQNGYILSVNPSFTKITGYAFEDVVGRDSSILYNDKNEQRQLHNLWRDVYLNGYSEGDYKGRRKDGGVYEGRVAIYCVHNKDGKLTNYVSLFSDIAQQKKSEEHIYKLAHFDLLTELPNRALFTNRLQQELLKARRDKKVLALMFVDLDKFKMVNDTYGHHVGDLLLQKVAKRLQNGIRESDTAARIGGDEFVILLPAIHSEKDAIRVGENISASLKRPYILKGQEVNIGASIGISIHPLHGANHEDLLSKADTAMYHAKHGGGSSVISYTDLMHQGIKTK